MKGGSSGRDQGTRSGTSGGGNQKGTFGSCNIVGRRKSSAGMIVQGTKCAAIKTNSPHFASAEKRNGHPWLIPVEAISSQGKKLNPFNGKGHRGNVIH